HPRACLHSPAGSAWSPGRALLPRPTRGHLPPDPRGERGAGGRRREPGDVVMLSDPLVLRAALERQLAILDPVARQLGDEVRAAGVRADPECRGPAAEAFRARDAELRGALRLAAAAADHAVTRIRLILAETS